MDAASSSPAPAPLRFVIFPWLGFGHLLPYLELAERLALRGHRVCFVSTPGNIARLPPLRAAAAPRVDLVPLPLPPVDGLPAGAESTNSVPHDKFDLLFKAFDGLAAPFAAFLAASCADDDRPDWVILDSFHHWAAAAAVDHKVPCAMLLPSAACMFATPRAAAAKERPPAVVAAAAAVPRYESEQRKQYSVRDGASGKSLAERYLLTRELCAVAAIRSSFEWEPEFLPLVAAMVGRPVLPLGLLPPPPDGARGGGSSTNRDHAAVRWLDAQPAGSVLYVALGSEVPLRAEQVRELALGLELAGTRFLWALRIPGGGDADDVLPAGFGERTGGRGLVTTGWVPQPAVLAHAAVGGFLTHCGRNSLVEGLLHGRPLVMLPIFGDQGPNARLMEGKKVGLQVPRDEHDGAFDRHGVASAVRAVMVEEETRGVFVANALKVQGIVADQELQDRYIDEFIRQLRSYSAALASPAETGGQGM